MQEWDRADVNKDGVVSDEEFSLELHDRLTKEARLKVSFPGADARQGKSADEVERLWERYHQPWTYFLAGCSKSSFRRDRSGPRMSS